MARSDGGRHEVTRRRVLQLMGTGAVVAAAACSPAATSPSPTVAATRAAATAASTVAATPALTPAPVPTPPSTPFDMRSMKDPLFDNHTHPIVPTQGDQTKYVDGLVQLMDQNSVAFSVMHRNAQWVTGDPTFGPSHDDWIRAAMERHPGRILGGLGGFDPASPAAPAYVRAQLQTGKWAYIGELDLRNPGPKTQIPINSPVMLEIARIAAEFKVALVFHYNPDYPSGDPQVGLREIEDAVAKNPSTIFMQAHNPPVPLMQKYPNLWGEMSLFNPQMPNQQFLQQLSAAPSTLDRLCLCVTDLQTPDLQVVAGLPRPLSYKDAAAAARGVLAGLPPDLRDRIAYKNLMRLLKLS